MVEPAAAVGVQVVRLGVTVGGAAPEAIIVAPVRLNAVIAPERSILIEAVLTLVLGILAGTAVTMFPSGIETLAVNVASPATLQLMPSVSAAPTLSVSVTVTVGSQLRVPKVVPRVTVPPPYVPVEEVLVVEGFVGAVAGLRIAVAVTWVPFSLNGSFPLARLKVPLSV